MIASHYGHSEIVKMLLEGGADVNMQDDVREGDMGCVFLFFFFFNYL